MLAHHSRKVLLAALLATILAAPASASDNRMTAQQTEIGQVGPEIAALNTSPIIAKESFQTVTKGRIAEPPARQKLTELRPSIPTARQPSVGAGHYRPAAPLILGIGY